MCWPLSGGGGGSPSRSGSVCTAPPSVGRASWSITSCPRSTSSSAADRPARPPPTTATLRRTTRADDPELLRQGELRLAVEDVIAARLDPLERRAVEARERADAGGAAAVERAEQAQAVLEVGTRACALVGHQRLPGRRDSARCDVVLRHPERGELVLRKVDASELPVLADVAHDVDQLERDPERLRLLRLVGAVHADAGDPDRSGDMRAVVAERVEVS